mmetsp:Transcript_74224/g.209628  ORF Transcript_74224/g.209628 Transcript_74224/m.209628 type:complete len:104 (+) Transcript_74224:2-313(+)
MLAAMWAPAAASVGFLGASPEGAPQDKKNKVNRAGKEVRHAEAEVHGRLLAVDREASYVNGTNATLASLQGSLGRAKKDLKSARRVLKSAQNDVAKKHHKKHQ